MESSSTTTSLETGSSHSSIHLDSSVSSVHSLNQRRQQQSPNISRVYKQASELFLTRRIAEALDALEPIIRRPGLSSSEDEEGQDESPGAEDGQNGTQVEAPIAVTSSRSARIKVWSLYISILNEALSMSAEEGKREFGSAARWKHLTSKAKDGNVWEEVVKDGYGGAEGSVDADVVANLATLLLTHATSQKITQERLETYLSASNTPSLDVASHMQRPKAVGNHSQTNGTSTPRDLNSRLRILEIYVLHVLPRNEEWQYAREFVNMSEVLDEERREAFLQALQSLEDEKHYDAKREAELQRQRDQQLEDTRRKEAEEEARRAHAQEQVETPSTENKKEQDFGIDKSRPDGAAKAALVDTTVKTPGPGTTSQPRRPTPPPQRSTAPSAAAKKSRAPPPGLYHRATHILSALHQSLLQMGQNMSRHPMGLLRTVLFMLAVLLALARQDVRDRIARYRDQAWEKIKKTVGMGVKVSYI